MSAAASLWPDDRCHRTWTAGTIARVIYCVVPEELAGDLYDQLVAYYADDPDVTVIVDRRKGSRRAPGSSGGGMRERRDRRRSRVTGDFPRIEAAE
jgi:hypothetical protein